MRFRMVVALFVGGMATVASTACTEPSAVAERAVPGIESGTLRTPVSVRVIARIEESTCVPGTDGSPGPGTGGDWCYFLDPGMTVTRAERVDLLRQMDDFFAVSMELLPDDRAALAALTTPAVGRQLAISVDGRVVQAPRIIDPITVGTIQLTGTEAEARALFRQLTG